MFIRLRLLSLTIRNNNKIEKRRSWPEKSILCFRIRKKNGECVYFIKKMRGQQNAVDFLSNKERNTLFLRFPALLPVAVGYGRESHEEEKIKNK